MNNNISGIVDSIVTGSVPTSINPGAILSVPYFPLGIYNSGNIFTAQLSDANGSFTSPVTVGSVVSTVSGNISAAIPSSTPYGTAYRMRVISSNPFITGSDNGQDITIGNPNAVCDIPPGENTTSITSSSAKVKWNAVAGAMYYKLRYKVLNTNSWTTIAAVNATHKTIQGLSLNTSYVWEVKSICSTIPLINSDWSAKQQFTTLMRQSANTSDETSVEISPNPFSSSATISFALKENSCTQIELFDLTGRKIKTLLNENVEAGEHDIILNRQQLSAGLYFIQLKMNDEMVTKKIILQ